MPQRRPRSVVKWVGAQKGLLADGSCLMYSVGYDASEMTDGGTIALGTDDVVAGADTLNEAMTEEYAWR